MKTAIHPAWVLSALVLTPLARATPPPTGDLHERYRFEDTGEMMPYRVYVPRSYDGTREYPLVVVLHGSSTTADDVMDVPGLKEQAERRDVVLVAPQGYSAFGGYGDIYPVVVTRWAASQVDSLLAASRPGAQAPKGMTRPAENAPPAAPDDYAELKMNGLTDPKVSAWSEKDTLNVLARVRAAYRIDATRIYLIGNSMGGGGVAYLAARYPDIWAAIAPSGGPFAAWSYPYFQLRDHHVAALFIHGERDEHANWKWSQAIVDQARKEGVDARLLMVPGGDHVHAWRMVMPQTFDFLLAHRRQP
ncbi:MAG TPA: PHB depolymerase family esterase [Steroidobacteraceae bacterium]|nr:PHB depolymerase family esterase [Steroidobacteraceae bacterium]